MEQQTEQIIFMDKLECDKIDTEIVIQQLHNAFNKYEGMKEKESNACIKLKLNGFLNELNKELEWNEQILQELNESIEFEETRGID